MTAKSWDVALWNPSSASFVCRARSTISIFSASDLPSTSRMKTPCRLEAAVRPEDGTFSITKAVEETTSPPIESKALVPRWSIDAIHCSRRSERRSLSEELRNIQDCMVIIADKLHGPPRRMHRWMKPANRSDLPSGKLSFMNRDLFTGCSARTSGSLLELATRVLSPMATPMASLSSPQILKMKPWDNDDLGEKEQAPSIGTRAANGLQRSTWDGRQTASDVGSPSRREQNPKCAPDSLTHNNVSPWRDRRHPSRRSA